MDKKAAFTRRVGLIGLVLALGIAPLGFAGGPPEKTRGYGPGMMGGGLGGLDSSLQRSVDFKKAQALVTDYLASLSDKNLKIDEIMEFEFNLYVLIEESDTGKGAFELLVDPFTGVIRPEFGPNMMWNIKYGMMGTRSGAVRSNVIGAEEAKKIAAEYLERVRGDGPYELGANEFHGYYTLDYKKNGMVLGMLSVNAFSRQVWYHTWHGGFIREQEGMGGM